MGKGGVLPGVQYLRYFAALLVVLSHTWQLVPKVGARDLSSGFDGGASGVDIFFVISGFIMVYITQARETRGRDFFLHRVLRIAPAYWVATLIMTVCLIIAPSLFSSAHLTLVHVGTSFLFVPWPHPVQPGALPLLQVGWTLNYEMLFYLIFAISMGLHYHARVSITTLVLLALCIIGAVTGPSQNAWVQFFTFTIMLEFVFGMGIALLVNWLPKQRGLGVGVAVAGIVGLSIAWQLPIARLDPLRFVVWGVPAAVLALGVVQLDRINAIGRNKFALLLGDSSYSLYLTHLFVLGLLGKVWAALKLATVISDLALIATGVIGATLAGIAFHILVEKPLSACVRKKIAKQYDAAPVRDSLLVDPVVVPIEIAK